MQTLNCSGQGAGMPSKVIGVLRGSTHRASPGPLSRPPQRRTPVVAAAAHAAEVAPAPPSRISPAFDASKLSPKAVAGLGPHEQHFVELLGVQSAQLAAIAEKLELSPLEGAGVGRGFLQASSKDGTASTCVQAFEGQHLDRVTAGWAAFKSPVPTAFSRLTAWVDPSIDAPHLSFELACYGDAAFMWLHMLPRRELLMDPPYLDKYYARPLPGCQRSFMALEEAAAGREGWRPFKSSQALVRCISSGLAISFWLPPGCPDSWGQAGEVAQEAVGIWLAGVGAAERVSERAGREDVQRRDKALKWGAAWGDASFSVMEKTFGREALLAIGELLGGGPPPPGHE